MAADHITTEPIFSPPAHGMPTVSEPVAASTESVRQTFPDAMEVFIAWERLRLLYNAILVVSVLLHLKSLLGLFHASFLLEAALAANVCFCAGPVAEGYLCLL